MSFETIGVLREKGVKAATEISEDTLVCLDAAGVAVPAADIAGYQNIGMCQEYVKGGTADSEVNVKTRSGFFFLKNSAADACDAIGQDCYVEDSTTVKKSAGNTLAVGYVFDILDDGVIAFIK